MNIKIELEENGTLTVETPLRSGSMYCQTITDGYRAIIQCLMEDLVFNTSEMEGKSFKRFQDVKDPPVNLFLEKGK